MVRAVLFDLGDTLFDLNVKDPRRYLAQGLRLAYDFLAQRNNNLPTKETYVRRVGRRVAWAYIWSQWTLREIKMLKLIQSYHRARGIHLDGAAAEQYARLCHEPFRRVFKAAPGAHETLRRVRDAGYSVGLVSNTFMISKVLDEALAAAGMIDYFDERVYSCDLGYMKPHPRIFQAALDGMGAPAGETMFIGDLIDADIRGAGRLGMTTVLIVPDGRLPAGRHRPDHVIRRITEVPALLPRCRG